MFKNYISTFKTATAALIVFTLALAAFSSGYAAAPAAADKPSAKTTLSSEKPGASAAPLRRRLERPLWPAPPKRH